MKMREIRDFFYRVKENPDKYFINNTKGTKVIYLWYCEKLSLTYIGIGSSGRPTAHKNDLLTKALCNGIWEFICIENLDSLNAATLEAAIIQYGALEYGLSTKGSNEIHYGRLINKQRELSIEKQIPYRIVDGNNIIGLIRGKTYNY